MFNVNKELFFIIRIYLSALCMYMNIGGMHIYPAACIYEYKYFIHLSMFSSYNVWKYIFNHFHITGSCCCCCCCCISVRIIHSVLILIRLGIKSCTINDCRLTEREERVYSARARLRAYNIYGGSHLVGRATLGHTALLIHCPNSYTTGHQQNKTKKNNSTASTAKPCYHRPGAR